MSPESAVGGARVIERAEDLDFSLIDTPSRPAEVAVVMADPAHFDVEYVINPHMALNIGKVDRALARAQWLGLKATYEGLGYTVHVVPAVPGLPDLVFAANQSFPGRLPDGQWAAVLSLMHTPQRRPEVGFFADWYAARGAKLVDLRDRGLAFEGMGDAAWLPGHQVVLAGYGFRTERAALDVLAELFEVPVLALKLVDPRFYHLDTCLSILSPQVALWVPQAFDEPARALLRAAFPTLIAVPFDEAVTGLACNGHSPNGKHFIVHRGAQGTMAAVRAAGLEVLEVDTGEFLKSGGSVYCMKLMLP